MCESQAGDILKSADESNGYLSRSLTLLPAMKKSLLLIWCLLGFSSLQAQFLPPPEFFVGPRFNWFSVGQQEEQYTSTLQNRPSIGLAAGIQFASAERLNVPIYMGFEAVVLRQNVFHVFAEDDLARTTDYSFQQLNLVIPLRWYLLHRKKDPLKAYVQTGLSFKLLNHGSGYTETIRQVETSSGMVEEQRKLVAVDERITDFRFINIPIEGGFIFYPGKGDYGVGISGGLLLPEITTRNSGLGYTTAWVSLTFNAVLTRPDAYGF